MRRIVLLLVFAAAVVGGWYFASPWLAMQGLRDAAQDVDREELAQRIDFPAVQESLKEQIRTRAGEETEGRGSLIERIGGAIAGGAADGLVDLAATPTGMAAIITTGAIASPLIPEAMRSGEVEWDVERDGLNSFRGVGTTEDGGATPVLHFARDGMGWKLVDVELPD